MWRSGRCRRLANPRPVRMHTRMKGELSREGQGEIGQKSGGTGQSLGAKSKPRAVTAVSLVGTHPKSPGSPCRRHPTQFTVGNCLSDAVEHAAAVTAIPQPQHRGAPALTVPQVLETWTSEWRASCVLPGEWDVQGGAFRCHQLGAPPPGWLAHMRRWAAMVSFVLAPIILCMNYQQQGPQPDAYFCKPKRYRLAAERAGGAC